MITCRTCYEDFPSAFRRVLARERWTMATSSYRGTAKIYQFPTRVRAAADDRREEAKPAELVSMRVAEVAFGGSWYHEAAFQEAERALKR